VQPFKISFHFFASSDREIDTVMGAIAEMFPSQKIVMCGEIGHNATVQEGQPLKYCVDIVAATKADAVNYLTRILDIKKGVVAGDSGNDVDMLLNSDNMDAVLVGGYKSEAINYIDKATASVNKSGKFRKVRGNNGLLRSCYVEQDDALGPESIKRALNMFRRAINMKNARERREKQ
jgi:hydroxymethylpyrimidine pyrophosphatase-like HAD family hydrolase